MKTGNLEALENTMFWKWLLRLEKALLIICSVSTVALIVISVILRQLFKTNIYGSEEILMIFAIWLYFIGSAYGSFENSHIKADIINLYVKNQRLKSGIGLIALMITTTINIIITKWAFDYFLWGMQRMPLTTGLKIPLVISQSSIFVGFLLMAFYHVYYLIRDTKSFFAQTPSRIIKDGEGN